MNYFLRTENDGFQHLHRQEGEKLELETLASKRPDGPWRLPLNPSGYIPYDPLLADMEPISEENAAMILFSAVPTNLYNKRVRMRWSLDIEREVMGPDINMKDLLVSAMAREIAQELGDRALLALQHPEI